MSHHDPRLGRELIVSGADPDRLPDRDSLLPAHPGAEPVPAPADGREVFTRERQVVFCEALATTGAVRSASVSCGVSHQTVYRARRSDPVFRRAWDAALLAARAHAEDVLACRAIDGVEEEVWYHGEVVATRRRHDSRLLLAHLARLDRLAADARTSAFAEDFEAALARFARGEAEREPEAEPEADGISPGQCNKRSNRPVAATDGGPLYRRAMTVLESGLEFEDEGDDDLLEWNRRWRAMMAARPHDAPPLEDLGDRDEVEHWMIVGFEAGLDQWWLLKPEEVAELVGAQDDDWEEEDWEDEDWVEESSGMPTPNPSREREGS